MNNPTPPADALQKARELAKTLDKAEQMALICTDWHLEEVQIDEEMVRAFDLRDEFKAGKDAIPSIVSELEMVTAERDELKEITSRVFGATKMQTVSEFVAKSDVERRRLEHERDELLKGYRAMRNWIIMEPCGCENECDRCRLSKNLLNSFPEIK